MKNKLIIKCSDALDLVDWMILSAKGEIIDHNQGEQLSELNQKVNLEQCQVVLLMQSSDIVIKNIQLPKRFNSSQLKKMIPNILEEDLISNIDSIHFSYGKVNQSQVCVAIVAQDKLNHWIEKLKQFHIEPAMISPLCLSMNINPNEWHIWVEPNQCVVRIRPEMGFFIENDQLPLILNHLYDSETIKPNKIHLNGDETTIAALSFTPYPNLLSLLQHDKQSVWEAFHPEPKIINLIHSEFAKSDELSHYKQYAFHAIALFCFVLVMLLGFEINDIISYHKISHDQKAQINEIYHSIYPQATSVVSPKQRMEQDLKFTSAGSSAYFDLLFYTGQALNKNHQLILKGINYKAGALSLTLEATNYADIEQLINQLKNDKLTVKQNKTEQQKDKLTATITITKGAGK